MISGHIIIQDEMKEDVRYILAGSLTGDGFLFFDKIEDNESGRHFVERMSLSPEQTKEFYKQLKQRMEAA